MIPSGCGATGDPLERIARRPVQEADLPFLAELYASTRWQELAPTGWSDAHKRAFLAAQFAAQHRHYLEHFAGAAFELLLHRGDGGATEPIGRLYRERRADEIRLIDIALLPAWRGRGIGGALVAAVLAEADTAGLAARLHVERENPAYRLYRRAGFRDVEVRGVYVFMERPAAGAEAPEIS